MAIDRIIVSTNNIDPNILNRKMFRPIRGSSTKDIFCGGISASINNVILTYLPRLNAGTLFMDFNVSKIMSSSNSNIDSYWCINIQDLWQRLYTSVKPIADITGLVNLRYWKVSYYEFNFDIVAHEEIINSYYKFVSKVNIPRRKRYSEYEDVGTIYNLSGKNLGKSNVKEKVYNKTKEMYDKGLIKTIPSTQVLRFELTVRRDKILYDFKHNKALPKYQEFRPQLFKRAPDVSFLGRFDEIMYLGFQKYLFNALVLKYGINVKIVTIDKLNTVVNNSSLSSTRKKGAQQVVGYLNGRTKNVSFSPKTISLYKKVILDMGYHYLTSSIELPIVSFEMIYDTLTQEQKLDIEKYAESNLVKDNLELIYSKKYLV